jgi:hypothetical protein
MPPSAYFSSPPPRGPSSLCQHPGSPGWPQHTCRLVSLIRLFLTSSRSLVGQGRSTRRLVRKALGLGRFRSPHILTPLIWSVVLAQAPSLADAPATTEPGSPPRNTRRNHLGLSTGRHPPVAARHHSPWLEAFRLLVRHVSRKLPLDGPASLWGETSSKGKSGPGSLTRAALHL